MEQGIRQKVAKGGAGGVGDRKIDTKDMQELKMKYGPQNSRIRRFSVA